LGHAEILDKTYGLDQSDHEDNLALRGRLLKGRLLESPAGDHPALTLAAAEAYYAAYQKTGGGYSGINAASLYNLAGQNETARKLAKTLLQTLKSPQSDRAKAHYYYHATRLLQAPKEQEVARFAHLSHISHSPPAHLALHSLQDVFRMPCDFIGVQRVNQSPMVNPPPPNRLLNNTSRTVSQTAAHATSQVGSSEGLVDSAHMNVVMHSGTVSRKDLSSVPVVCTSSQAFTEKRSRQVSEHSDDD
jgi:hypothetical protein